MDWPDWWYWKLAFSDHCIERMEDRGFSELDVRVMLEDATECVAQDWDTFLVKSTLNGNPWEVIVVPDYSSLAILVVTAYRSAE